jgi:hypothetical protein
MPPRLFRMKQLQAARPFGKWRGQNRAHSRAPRKSLGTLEHDHAKTRKTGVSQRVQSIFFSVIAEE